MEKYLRMSDVFGGSVEIRSSNSRHVMCEGVLAANCFCADSAEYAAHAINSHDELVEMNKELLAVIERVIGSSNEFAKIMGTSEWADGYKQCSIDTGEALLGMLDNIKAKGTA